jgi:hypothetical protein
VAAGACGRVQARVDNVAHNGRVTHADIIVQLSLQKMRDAFNSDPESLLETWGGAGAPEGDYCYIDLVGHDDQIESTVLVDRYPLDFRIPLRQRLTVAMVESPPVMEMPSVATYRPTNWHSRLALSAQLLPGWRHDFQSFLVGISLHRYRRVMPHP